MGGPPCNNSYILIDEKSIVMMQIFFFRPARCLSLAQGPAGLMAAENDGGRRALCHCLRSKRRSPASCWWSEIRDLNDFKAKKTPKFF